MEDLQPSDQSTPTTLQRTVSGLPLQPGVYLHKDSTGLVIYVGKAKNLRNRVRSYFQKERVTDAKTKALMDRIADVEVIVTDTEAEALILENTLIKEHKPRYNVLLRDDKSYPYIRITKEAFPRVFKTRTVIKDGSKYYGPYTDGTYLFYLLKTLRALFPLRSCDLPLTEQSISAGRWSVCLDYHIKKCEGPCEGFVSSERYNQHIMQAQQILVGKTRDLERQLEEQMTQLADELRFEDASVIRQRLQTLQVYTAKQKVANTDEVDRDVFAVARIGSVACTVVFAIRDGKLIGKRHYFAANSSDMSESEIVSTTLQRWYIEGDSIPEEILLPCEIADQEMVGDYLQVRRGSAITMAIPKIGDKRKLLAMAEMNADVLLRELLLQQAQKDQSMPKAVLDLQRDLQMKHMPKRIECFDNSHMHGTEYVASMVVFVDGRPKKSEYRHYKLRTVVGNDDFSAMKEVMTRRFGRAIEEGTPLPDVVVIDGGKGQLSHAMEVLQELGIAEELTVIGLAKRLEEVFLPGLSDPVYLPKVSSSLRLLQQARDEAHRFAVTFHRTLRSKRTLQTELTKIAGVGETTAGKLLVALGSVDGVRSATQTRIAEVVGVKLAKIVFAYFHSDKSASNDVVQP